MTLQGRAIHEAALRFGDGRTLPFTPCKKGFVPLLANNGNQRMFACPLHHDQRRQRFVKEEEQFRRGEVDLTIFWKRQHQADTDAAEPPADDDVDAAKQNE